MLFSTNGATISLLQFTAGSKNCAGHKTGPGMIIFSSERFHRAAYRWLPFCWMILAGTQGLGMLRLLGINIGGESGSATAGSPVERILFMSMLALGLYLLARRSELLGRTFKANADSVLLYRPLNIMVRSSASLTQTLYKNGRRPDYGSADCH